MESQTYDPKRDPAVAKAIAVYRARNTTEVQGVLELLRHRLNALDCAWRTVPPGPTGDATLRHLQGQAHVLQGLIDDIENGPEEVRAEKTLNTMKEG